MELNVAAFVKKVKVVSSQHESRQAKSDVPLAQSVITLINNSTSKISHAKLSEAFLASF